MSNTNKMTKTKANIYFIVCVLFELAGNFLINFTDGYTILWPTIGCMALYAACFFCFGKALEILNLGIAYAVWAGVSIVFLAIVSVLVLHQHLNRADVIGIVIIMIGVVGINLKGSADDDEPALEQKEDAAGSTEQDQRK